MALPLRPQLRPVELVPVGPREEALFVLRDPEGFGQMVVMPYGAAVLTMLMNGQRTLLEIQTLFKSQTGVPVALSDLEAIVRRLDETYLLAGERFDEYRRAEVEKYLKAPVRPPSHAGGAYEADAKPLRKQLARLFTCKGGPGAVDPRATGDGRQLCGIVSPHIDLHRGGPAFAWAYKQVAERCDADLFVIFGTAHNAMEQLFCVTRKDFDTPLGIVRTDGQFIDRLCEDLDCSVAGQQIDLFADELVHRFEHSIEFQAVFLQYVLGGKREFKIVPVLTGSFQEFLAEGAPPSDSPEVQAFLVAVRAAAGEHRGSVCYVSGADFAHIGQRFGDEWPVDEKRQAEQADDDRKLLEAACRCDPAAVFAHVAKQQDRSRICGLSPTYTMLELISPARGELLKYDQAVEPDGSSCITFASVAFYREP